MPNERRSYRLSPLAVADLESIWLYTFERWSLEQADRYHHDMIDTSFSSGSPRAAWMSSASCIDAWMSNDTCRCRCFSTETICHRLRFA